MPSHADRASSGPPAIALPAIGLVGGVLSGLVGVGGGIVMIPLMVGVLGFSQHRAHGTSLAVIVPIAFAATVRYAVADPIEWAVAAALAATSVVFATAGARLTARINPQTLRRLFALVLLITAVRMFLSIDDAALFTLDEGQRIVAGVITGVVTGLVSGTMGVGGGIVMVPAMVILMGIEQHLAQGISLAVIVPTALSGGVQHFRMGNVATKPAMLIALGGIGGGLLGAQLAQVLSGGVLRIIFAVFVMISAYRMLGVQGWLRQRLRWTKARP